MTQATPYTKDSTLNMKEVKSVQQLLNWFEATQKTTEEMFTLEKNSIGDTVINCLAPVYGEYYVTIYKDGYKWVVFTEDDHYFGETGNPPSEYRTKKEAVTEARGFAQLFYDCYLENTEG